MSWGEACEAMMGDNDGRRCGDDGWWRKVRLAWVAANQVQRAAGKMGCVEGVGQLCWTDI